MFEYDEFGLFTNENQLSNFLFYLTTLYPHEFYDLQYFAIPENELSFLYLISEVFDNPLISDYQDFRQLVVNVDIESRELDDDKREVIEFAFNLLAYSIQINDIRKISITYGVLIKNAIDISVSEYDIVQHKQYEVVSIAKNYQEIILNNQFVSHYERW